MVEEARLERSDYGLTPTADGWFATGTAVHPLGLPTFAHDEILLLRVDADLKITSSSVVGGSGWESAGRIVPSSSGALIAASSGGALVLLRLDAAGAILGVSAGQGLDPVAMAAHPDGSVRTVLNTIAPKAWEALGTRAGGEVGPNY